MRGSGNSPAGEWSGRVPGLVPGLYTVLLLVGGGGATPPPLFR